ncbi:MAG: thiolase family protein [Candidatus Velthaea sp.]
MSVRILGVGMTTFARHPQRTLRDLALEAARAAIADAGIDVGAIEAALVGNAMAGTMTGQQGVRGQTVLRGLGLPGGAILNIENACASGASALHLAHALVASGAHECVLALGVEKLYDEDRAKTMEALAGASEAGAANGNKTFMEVYAERVQEYMARYGTTVEHLAQIAAKNRANGALNPLAGLRTAVSIEEVLASPLVAEPLRRLMCSPITDGAAAAIVCSERFAAGRGGGVGIRASVLVAGDRTADATNEDVVSRAAARAYEQAALGPNDVGAFEVHDAAASGELLAYAGLGVCRPGEEGRFLADNASSLHGRSPFNPSGGLQSRGNPSGATGLAQIAECVWQLRGTAGARQIPGVRVALAENAGGVVDDRTAAVAIHVLAA